MREQSYLILLALVPEPLYGYGIIAAVRELSDGLAGRNAGAWPSMSSTPTARRDALLPRSPCPHRSHRAALPVGQAHADGQ
jgi:hypothetical protein